MFEVLIREAAVRFGLGDKALPVLQMLLAYMTARESGGLAGFLEKFKAAGLGPIIQSWLGGGPAAQPIANSQIETVLGSSGGLLSLVTGRFQLERDSVTSALGYLMPALVGKLTPGGSIAGSLPPEVAELAAAGQPLLAAPIPAISSSPGGAVGGVFKWLPWVIVALAVVFGASYWSKGGPAETAPPQTPASAAGDAAAPMPATPMPSASNAAPDSTPTAVAVPAGAAVVASEVGGQPSLAVYFDVGKTDVAPDFASQARPLVDYLKAHDGVQAVISGFADPTGDAAANEELARNRARAVQATLVALGIAEDRTVLERPAPGGIDATHAAERRVDVTLRVP